MLTGMVEGTKKKTVDFRRLKGLKVLVVGLGRSGLSAARMLQYADARVFGVDRANPQNIPEWIEVLPYDCDVKQFDLVVISPGVPWTELPVVKALKQNLEIIGELELAYQMVKGYQIPWIAITGTNGKTTTTTLVDLMLKTAGYNVLTGGNIGKAVGDVVLDALTNNHLNETDYIVVEVSSFQLESIREFAPHIGAVLNITEDHMDRYRGMKEYIDAKRNISINQTEEDYIVLNFDDPITRAFAEDSRARAIFFSTKHEIQGANLLKEDIVVDRGAGPERVLKAKEVALRGLHNLENALAATAICSLAGCDLPAIATVLKDFRGLEHRMEMVAEFGGVTYINDSKGTNLAATVKSIEGIAGPVVLILGGRDKGGDFSVLRNFRHRIKALVSLGEAREKIKKELSDLFQIEEAVDMEQAVQKAASLASPGDTVLLSPGCASFDMFKNYEHRGEVFKTAVRRLMR